MDDFKKHKVDCNFFFYSVGIVIGKLLLSTEKISGKLKFLDPNFVS